MGSIDKNIITQMGEREHWGGGIKKRKITHAIKSYMPSGIKEDWNTRINAAAKSALFLAADSVVLLSAEFRELMAFTRWVRACEV